MSAIDTDDLQTNKELYEALMKKDDDKVLEICARIPKGPLHTVTIHDDTVIHMAIYHKKTALALTLIDMVRACDSHKLTWQNSSGSTILHETGTNNKTVVAAKEMLRRAPMLLSMTNRQGETALFYAARHGKTQIFKFLHDEVTRANPGPDMKTFLVRQDKSTILHLAILSRNYWMAHEIAVRHKHLITEKDEDEMTPLQLLSCRPLDISSTNFFTRFVYKAIDPNVDDTSRMLSPLKRMRKNKFKSEWAMKLIKLLVKEDTSWENTESRLTKHRAKFHQYGKSSSATQLDEIPTFESLARLPDTPLLLATKYRCTQVVEEILESYPQAIEHVDQDGRNILHIAILYRNHEVFDLVVDTKYAKQRLRGKIDNDANTLLHMVGEEAPDVEADLKGPALVLQDNMKLFKKVANICTTLDRMKLNSKSKTAEQLFNENNNQRRNEAKEWMIENAKNYTVVAVLIATVAFAAEYTVPGGSDPKSGLPILKKKPLFFVFTVADAASLSTALTAVIMFLNIITSTYRFKDFETSLIRKLTFGLFLLMVSVAMMMVAFAATLILTVSSGRKWTDIVLYVVSFFPVIVFLFTYFQSQSIPFSSKIKGMINYMHSWFANPKPAVRYRGPQ
uniref:Ankyrin repeat-containing protein At5g02620-like n=1 Tax=Tanacetum cinerariifolium TaxID=118510 RepID=A0A6L2LQK7_TANCI|nr:ankyrin repeat-containing protein At5g02620-like [Tanacetum cinerariifolium]